MEKPTPDAAPPPPPRGGATSGPATPVPRWPWTWRVRAMHRGCPPAWRAEARGSQHGFTLVELMVALFVLSLVAVLSWRGLDGMIRTQSQTQARADQVLALQVGVAQWKADLDALVQLPEHRALDWNGRVLRMTRSDPADPAQGIRVTAWAQGNVNGQSTWLRWQSPPLRTRGEVEDAWRRADAWSQNQDAQDRRYQVAVAPMVQWQLYFHRGGAWTNPQSSDAGNAEDAPPTPAKPPATSEVGTLPDGVRLELALPANHPLAGLLRIDWLNPRLNPGARP